MRDCWSRGKHSDDNMTRRTRRKRLLKFHWTVSNMGLPWFSGVFVFAPKGFIGKIGNSGIVNHPPKVFFDIWTIELEHATSVSQAPPPQHYPDTFHIPRMLPNSFKTRSSPRCRLRKVKFTRSCKTKRGLMWGKAPERLIWSNDFSDPTKWLESFRLTWLFQTSADGTGPSICDGSISQIFFTFCCLRLSRSKMRFRCVLRKRMEPDQIEETCRRFFRLIAASRSFCKFPQFDPAPSSSCVTDLQHCKSYRINRWISKWKHPRQISGMFWNNWHC